MGSTNASYLFIFIWWHLPANEVALYSQTQFSFSPESHQQQIKPSMALEVLQSPSSPSFDFDFDFNHGRSSPCLSTPSSPKGFGFSFFSTPTSPARGFDDFGFDVQPKTPSEKRSRTPLLHHQLPPLKQPPQSKKTSLWSTFSPRRKKSSKTSELERGRERVSTLSTSKTTKREARSLSPEKRRWRLKDLLLFRSASEGRGSDKDPFNKYTFNMGSQGNVRVSSGHSSPSASKSNKKGQLVSAHELHYKANKAMSDDMRKRSFLPYKQGILGKLAVNPTVHALAHGFGSLAHSHPTKYNY